MSATHKHNAPSVQLKLDSSTNSELKLPPRAYRNAEASECRRNNRRS